MGLKENTHKKEKSSGNKGRVCMLDVGWNWRGKRGNYESKYCRKGKNEE